MIPLHAIVVAVVVVLAVCVESADNVAGTVANKLIIRFNVIPDKNSYFVLPRTQREAQKDSYQQVGPLRPDHTTRWCHNGEYSVCLLFDRQGSIAGMETSVSVEHFKESNLPVDYSTFAEWKHQTIFGIPVYTATAYFVRQAVLDRGGRRLTEKTLTAPEGVFLLQTDRRGVEKHRLHLTTDVAGAEKVGFHKQGCYPSQGLHYSQGVTPTIPSCKAIGIYNALYSQSSHRLVGFNVHAYGRVPKTRKRFGRQFYENVPTFFLKISLTNAPQCAYDWTDKYGFFGAHVYFVDKPYYLTC